MLTMVSTKRKLSADERTVEPADASAALFPAVVEPTADDASLATELGGALGARVLLHLELYGAVLLRGWRVHTADDLAIAVAALSAHGLTCLSDYFPAESGRDERLHAFGATVWPTNSLKPTGNYLVPEVVPHTENYYALEAPRVIAFSCERAPWLGGETAIFDGLAALSELPPPLRAQLSTPCVAQRVLSLHRLAARHSVHDLDALTRRLHAQHAESATLRPIDTAPGFVRLSMARTVVAPPPPSLTRGAPSMLGAALSFNFGEFAHLPGARIALLRGLHVPTDRTSRPRLTPRHRSACRSPCLLPLTLGASPLPRAADGTWRHLRHGPLLAPGFACSAMGRCWRLVSPLPTAADGAGLRLSDWR